MWILSQNWSELNSILLTKPESPNKRKHPTTCSNCCISKVLSCHLPFLLPSSLPACLVTGQFEGTVTHKGTVKRTAGLEKCAFSGITCYLNVQHHSDSHFAGCTSWAIRGRFVLIPTFIILFWELKDSSLPLCLLGGFAQPVASFYGNSKDRWKWTGATWSCTSSRQQGVKVRGLHGHILLNAFRS